MHNELEGAHMHHDLAKMLNRTHVVRTPHLQTGHCLDEPTLCCIPGRAAEEGRVCSHLILVSNNFVPEMVFSGSVFSVLLHNVGASLHAN